MHEEGRRTAHRVETRRRRRVSMNGVTVTATAVHGAEATGVRVAGELVFATASVAKPQLFALLDTGCRRLVVDASELDFLDSSGLGVLLAAWQRMQRTGGRLE